MSGYLPVNLFNAQDDCVMKQNCGPMKYLVHIGLDKLFYGSIPNFEAFYEMNFSADANVVEIKLISKEEAKDLDGNFVKTIESGKR